MSEPTNPVCVDPEGDLKLFVGDSTFPGFEFLLPPDARTPYSPPEKIDVRLVSN